MVYRNEILARAIPATTLATGRSFSSALASDNNLNVKDKYVRKTNKIPQWPKVRDGLWLHSDIKAIAYPYLQGLFQALVAEGERK